MARPTYPSDKQAQFMLRLPDGMRDRLKSAAEKNGRSMNAEIVDRLERSLAGADLSGTVLLEPAARIRLAQERLKQVLSLLDEHELSEMLR